MHLLKIELLTFLLISLLLIGLVLANYSKKRVNFSRTITFVLLLYGLLASELLLILNSITHYHSIRHIHVHIMRLFNETETTDDDIIPFDHLVIFVLFITVLLFFIALLLSQLSLILFSRRLVKKSNKSLQTNLISKYKWLPKKFKLVVINENRPDAYSFTIIRFKKFSLYAQDWIIVTSKMIELLNDDELEMVLAHEYSHVSEYDTRYSHLIFTIASIVFFDPVLYIFKRMINSRHEIDADLQAVEMIQKPKTLARALFKLLKSYKSRYLTIMTGISLNKKNLIIKRINLLIQYAENNNLEI